MPTRSLNVLISGDSKPLGVAAKQAEDHIGKVEHAGSRMGKALALGFATAGAAAAGGLVLGLKKSADAAKDAQASMAKVKVIVDNAGISFDKHSKQIDKVIQAHSRLTGFDDEDLAESFANMVRTTGKVSEAFKLNALAADIARAKGTNLAGAQSLLARVYNGSYNGIKKLGIAIEPVTKAQDKLHASTKNASAEQIKAAKAADKQATSQLAIAKLQKAFGGQAEAYGKTAAGAQARFGVALENVEEKLGAHLLPVMTKVTNAAATFLSEIDSGTGAGGKFADTVQNMGLRVVALVGSVRDVVGWFGRHKTATTALMIVLGAAAGAFAAYKIGVLATAAGMKIAAVASKAYAAAQAALNLVMDANPISLIVIAIAGLTAGLVVAYKRSETFRNIIDGAWSAIKSVAETVFPVIKKMMSLGLLGPIGLIITHFSTFKRVVADVWGALKDTASTVFPIVKRLMSVGLLGPLGLVITHFRDFKRIAGDAFDAVKSAAGKTADAINKIKDAISDVVGAVGKVGGKVAGFFGIGNDGIGITAPLPTGGAFGGSLQGASPALKPFAAIGARFGLGVSSGRAGRENRLTSSGNVSFHSTGEAIDMADGRGPDANKMSFFQYMKTNFGGRLAELIYGPGQIGIKNGQPYNFGPALNAQHQDHVHVAMDLGRPGVGIGDGLGKFDATSYGPPWGGIQGTGTTATGVNLHGSPHVYGVAVDPKVIPLGSKLKITPNPFNYGGTFTAFDTGGAIKGKRIDFYDWRGRKAQLGWGHKSVTVSTVSGGSGGTTSSGSSKAKAVNTTGIDRGGVGKVDNSVLYPGAAGGEFPSSAQAFQDLLHGKKPSIKGTTDDARPAAADSTTGAGDGGDPNQGLIDAQNAAKEAADNLAAALADVKASIDAQTAFAARVQTTDSFQLTKSLADLISGHIAGRGIAGRAFTPGTGVEFVY